MTKRKKILIGAGILAGAIGLFETIKRIHYANLPIEPNQLSLRGENDNLVNDSEKGTDDPC